MTARGWDRPSGGVAYRARYPDPGATSGIAWEPAGMFCRQALGPGRVLCP